MNALFCGRCGAQIPADSIFCPMCGFKTALPGAATMFELPRVMAPVSQVARRTRRLEQDPAPAGAESGAAQAGVAQPDEQVDAAQAGAAQMGAEDPVLELPVKPARRSTGRGRGRGRGSGRQRRAPTSPAVDQPPASPRPVALDVSESAPVEPGRAPVTPRPLRIVLGVLFLLVAAWLVLWFLPGNRPLSPGDEAALAARLGQEAVARERHARLSEEVHVAGNMGAGGLAFAGLGLILSGALYRAQSVVRCRRCLRPVAAWKGVFGLHCPLGEHYARVQWLLVIMTVFFWSALVVVVGLIGFSLS